MSAARIDKQIAAEAAAGIDEARAAHPNAVEIIPSWSEGSLYLDVLLPGAESVRYRWREDY